MPQRVPRVHKPLPDSGAAAGAILAAPEQEGVDTLSHGAVHEGLAGQGLVQCVLQGVAAFDLPTGQDVVHQVAFSLDVAHPGNL